MKKIFVLLLTSLLILSGCTSNSNTTPVATEVTIKHDLGTTVVPTNPEKVVIFDMGVLDTFNELELPVYGLPQSNVPSALAKYEGSDYKNAGTLFEPDYEALFNMEPELIIISGRAAEAYDQLSEIAPTIYVGTSNEAFMDSVYANLELFATIFPSHAETIETEITTLKADIKTLNDKASTEALKTLFVLANGDALSAYGSGSRFGMLYDDFGFPVVDESIEASTHGQEISFEYIANQNPGILVVMDRGVIVGSEVKAQDLLNNALVNSTDAAKNNKIVYVDAEVWYLMTGGLSATKTMVQELLPLFE